MKLNEKILSLRKKLGLSQEELAEKLNVSRQAVSRWEVGSAQPDASNVLQLSKLFGVTADYLLNDEYESDRDVPIVRQTESSAKRQVRRLAAGFVAGVGLLGNFLIYLVSRFVEVPVTVKTYQDGWYHYTGARDHSYWGFIREYDMEFLAALLWLMVAAGLLVILYKKIDSKAAEIESSVTKKPGA